MSYAFTASNQDIFQSRHNRFDIAVVLSRIHSHDVLIKMSVESCWIDVQNFTLSREDCENRLNAVELLAVTQVDIFNQMIQNFNEIREKFNVDDVSEPLKNKNKSFNSRSNLQTYFANPSKVVLSSFEFGFCFKILK